MSEPRSVRLNQTHRSDIVAAVMQEWRNQNPAPQQTSQVMFLKAVAEEFKNNPAYKRTERMVNALKPDDLLHIRTESNINVRINDQYDKEKRTVQVSFPPSLAEKWGLVHLGSTHLGSTDQAFIGLAKTDCEERDGWAKRSDGRCFVAVVSFAERNYPTVIMQEDHPALAEIEQVRKEYHAWQKEHDILQRETADLLAQYSTTKQLRDSWAEIIPYLPPHIADPERAVTLPVLATSRLSERLGIK